MGWFGRPPADPAGATNVRGIVLVGVDGSPRPDRPTILAPPMVDDISLPSNFGGLLFPLDMFRPTVLAAALAEGLAAQARNILDAKLVLTRHPEIQVVIARIVGSVVGDDEAGFWRDNPELALIASQVLPRQLFLYYVVHETPEGPEPRQGFVVLQRGQALAAEDATADQLPPDALPEDWPVARLLAQLGLGMDELADGFAGGPEVEISLVERSGDDRELLMTLAGQPPAGREGASEGQAPQPGPARPGAAATNQARQGAGQARAREAAATAAPARPAGPKRLTVEEDQKRRAATQQAEAEARQAKAASIRAELPYVVDELGVVVAPKAELSDTDILEPYLVSKLAGDVPPGLPSGLASQLAGRRIDFAVKVEFLSEVFFGEGPLAKPTFDAQAQERTLGGRPVKLLEVLAPRLGKGTFIRRERAGVFVSRTPDMELPETLIVELLDRQG